MMYIYNREDPYIYYGLFAEKGDRLELIGHTLHNRDKDKSISDDPEAITAVLASCIYEENALNKNDKVNHPSHYTWLKDKCGIEVIDITRHMDFDLGNAIKYILRSGHKSEEGYTDNDKTVEDLKKAIWYINDKISQLIK